MPIVIVEGPPPPDPNDGGDGPIWNDVPPPDVGSLGWSWTSWNGDTWDLTDWTSPVVKLKGATGMVAPAVPEHWWTDSNLDGSTWEGARIARGSLFLPLIVRGASSAEFLANNAAFLRSLNPFKLGVVRVTRPDSSWREVICRYESGADFAIDVDPVKSRAAKYGITWALADPYWYGQRVETTFRFGAVTPFFPGPPFHLSDSNLLGSSRVTNPGDVDSDVIWRIDGPFTGFSVGVGTGAQAAVATATVTKKAGEWIEIDMTPSELTVLDQDGTDLWTSLSDANFARIPPGDSDLTTTVTGAGAGSAATLGFTPRYSSALT